LTVLYGYGVLLTVCSVRIVEILDVPSAAVVRRRRRGSPAYITAAGLGRVSKRCAISHIIDEHVGGQTSSLLGIIRQRLNVIKNTQLHSHHVADNHINPEMSTLCHQSISEARIRPHTYCSPNHARLLFCSSSSQLIKHTSRLTLHLLLLRGQFG